jgi:hypothetical protein
MGIGHVIALVVAFRGAVGLGHRRHCSTIARVSAAT